MKQYNKHLNKRIIGGLSLFLVCLLGFTVYFGVKNRDTAQAASYMVSNGSGEQAPDTGTIKMRRASDNLQLSGMDTTKEVDTIVWESLAPENLMITGAVSGKFTGNPVAIRALKVGPSAVSVTVTYKDGTQDVITVTVDVQFSISEDLVGVTGVRMAQLYPDDERRSLIMDYGTSVPIGADTAGSNFLKLTLGNGLEAEWTVGNKDVIQYNPGGTGNPPRIAAVGAGPTTLHVSWTDGTETYEDEIKVYVRPQIRSADGNTVLAGTDYSSGSPVEPSNSVTVNDGDMIRISVQDTYNSQITIGDKIVWVIFKGQGENAKLVRDSLGNTGYDPSDPNAIDDSDDATLTYYNDRIQGVHYYRVDAKSGEYNVQFYVKGTYTNFEESRDDELRSNCDPVNLLTRVNCNFTDRTVTIGLNGSYDLSEAFNIPAHILREYFTITILDPEKGEPMTNAPVTYDQLQMLIRTRALGKAKVTVKLNAGMNISELPGFPADKDTAIVDITVSNTFSLNITEAEMSVGGKLDLHGIIGNNDMVEANQFKWSIEGDGDQYVSLSSTQGQYITVTAEKATPSNTQAVVRLAWTDKDGVTFVATCTIVVRTAADNFEIVPSEITLESGQTAILRTSIDAMRANIDWLSSDTSMVTVSANDGNVTAEITAGTKVGTAVITAYNKDNGRYATCVVTVTAPITDIRIDKGEEFTTTLVSGFVFLKALYEPANATETELEWTARNVNPNIKEPVASVDENGVVTLLTEGEVLITVKPKYNPNNVEAHCIITILEDPITKIITDVSHLEMIVGDIYQVSTTLVPETPSDPTLNWSVLSGEDVVTVDSDGRIIALSAGTAVVRVTGNPRKDGQSPAEALITITVRNRLESIHFSQKYYEVEVGGQLQLEVLFEPQDNVNKTLHFDSADPELATVNDEGIVTGVEIGGPVVITCWAEDIGKQSPIQCYVTVTKKKIPATDFAIEPTSKTVMVGYSFQITPKFTPEDTSDQTVLYESADATVAKVDENGKVTGVKEGVTAIICTPAQGGSGLTKSCTVTVIPAVKLTLSPSSREIAKGQSFTIKKIVTPSNADKSATWKTSNKSIATVSGGKVTGKKIGSCTITCTLTKSKVSATCRVKVAKLKTKIKLDKTNIRIGIGQTYKLKKTITTNASKNPGVKWKSSNKKIASVSSSGKVKGKRLGSAKITVTTTDKIKAKATCRVTVIRRITSVSINKDFETCFVGHSIKLKATVKPKNASIKKVKWSSSDKNIAKVSGGKVTGIAPGEVTITAKAKDGSGKKAECVVKVLEEVPVTSIVVAQNSMTLKKGDKAKLSYSVLPNKNSDTLKFASDNKRVAKVTSKGVVKAVGTGTAEITIMSSGGVTSKVTVNVVALNKTSLRMRQYDTEMLRVFGTDETVAWYTSNARVATVSGGTVTGKGKGSAYIYAYVKGCKLACKVTITSVNSKR